MNSLPPTPWMPGADLAGRTRLDRMDALRDSFERHVIAVRHDIVPGIGHNGCALLQLVKAFFADVLKSASGVSPVQALTPTLSRPRERVC